MKRNKRPSCWTISSTASRVVPGMGETIARSVPVSRLSSVDLPTLGWPIMATLVSVVGRWPKNLQSGLSVSHASFERTARMPHPSPTLGRAGVLPLCFPRFPPCSLCPLWLVLFSRELPGRSHPTDHLFLAHVRQKPERYCEFRCGENRRKGPPAFRNQPY